MPNLKHIEVVPYNPAWVQAFELEAARIKEALGENCVEAHHIGSTSVPGLAAKPSLDVLCVVSALASTLPLQELGYKFKGEINIPSRYAFERQGSPWKANFHVVESGHGFAALTLAFRDYLRTHSDTREAYAALKEEVLKDPTSYHRVDGYFSHYTLRKNDFIKDVLQKAGYQGRMITSCLHDQEWAAAKAMRQKYFFDKVLFEDPYAWTFDHPDHKHFILYKGAAIVGYAHIQLWPDHRAVLRIIVIEEAFRNHGLGAYFLEQCERGLKQQGYKVLQTEASPDALQFYERHGYLSMPFNDPKGHATDPRDTALGKVL